MVRDPRGDATDSRHDAGIDRRTYLQRLMGAATGASALAGCLGASAEFDPERVASETGRLPVHRLERRVEKVGEGVEQPLDPGNSGVSVSRTGDATQFDLRASVTGNDITHPGKVSASSTAKRETFWKAPAAGDYDVEARYSGHGDFGGSLDCPEISDDKALLFSSAHLAVYQTPENTLTVKQNVHLDHGDNGTGKLAREVVEVIVDFLVTRILSRWFGPFAGIIADQITSTVVKYGEAIFDVVTGECYTVYFDVRYDTEFSIDSSDPATLRTPSFSAAEGDLFKIQFAPVVGSALTSKVNISHSRAVMESRYRTESVSVRQA